MKSFAVGNITISVPDGLAIAPEKVSDPSTTTCDLYEGVPAGTGTAWLPNNSQTGTSCYLRNPNKSSGVYALQVSLNQCYGKNLLEDGYFGPVTERALRQVQAAIGTAPDGVYGPFTRDLMLHAGTWGDERFKYDGPGGG
ncbi:peptidoglycan-binding protein [Streptomyces gilvifuscus]|uniref:Peptidoglycan-binding domain-containing protein n=1 Tax=Streptomyces gilvifuscus TaxID=1550617 RepID=A0ABT5G3T9_9ACTN|nr:peptidoglycan-binding domain-containing protein [Streptomyces gilvifuscus]MDC2959282.1 peptidoglycan-binding domain-containing protein [Streptomyces gilvifuscus]